MSAVSMSRLRLGIPGFSYSDLHDPARLSALLTVFDTELEHEHPALYVRYRAYHDSVGAGLSPTELSALLVELAVSVAAFLGRLFGISRELADSRARILQEMQTVYGFRAWLVKRLQPSADAPDVDPEALRDTVDAVLQALAPAVGMHDDRELALCMAGSRLLHWQVALAGEDAASVRSQTRAALQGISGADADPESLIASLLNALAAWCRLCLQHPELEPGADAWSCLKVPGRLDPEQLVTQQLEVRDALPRWVAPGHRLRRRDGFALTDLRADLRQVLYEVEHCIYCHERNTDSCSKGMPDRRKGGFRSNPLGVTLTGCPLDQKISEMHWLKRQGDSLGALVLVMLDNPMCPGTGHRICNDCMKACIYQKTEPVDIPQIETRVLTDVLELPWGFELYDLLTRWNPINAKRPCALPYNGKNMLVVGMGPAGYTLSHYLLNEGFSVTGVDALKIEPLPESLVGAPGRAPQPVHSVRKELYESLDDRCVLGFGGVAEYGITVRWDKNFLKLIYLNLVRRRNFRCYGGIRFGGTLTIDDAWELGFDHIALATGAGKPTIIGLRNNLIRGIRKASDFLMALQLSGAARRDALANLQVSLPAGVIGGGLTAMDTATELLAYYPVQAERTLRRYRALTEQGSVAELRAGFDAEELTWLDTFLEHGRQLEAERQRAARAGELPDFVPLLQSWGGVTLFYRGDITDSPAYRQSHEEISKALEEGIYLAERLVPTEAQADACGALCAVRFAHRERAADGKWRETGRSTELPMKSLFIAAGTSPNTIYEQEHPYSFRMAEKFFQCYVPGQGDVDQPELEAVDAAPLKSGRPTPFTSYRHRGRYITFYGDVHPTYAGSVVKAMASARECYPAVVQLFAAGLKCLKADEQPARDRQLAALHSRLDELLKAEVTAVHELAPNIIEVIVKAPMQARKFEPGQFYRVQDYETLAPRVGNTRLSAEGLALTGASVDKERGLISLIALEMGSSSRLCRYWRPGMPLVVMGVTGSATHIPRQRNVLLAGGGLGNAVLFSIGRALRAANCRILYFAGYRKASDTFKMEEIEYSADTIVWAVNPGGGSIAPRRPQDRFHQGNIVEAMCAYADGSLGEAVTPMQDIDHIITIGSDRMMAAVAHARHHALKPFLKPDHQAIGSINSPMQCMMKGICAQCLCKHNDPDTGEEYFVYSCYNQDQELDRVDFDNLHARLRQNSVQEKLSALWLHALEDR